VGARPLGLEAGHLPSRKQAEEGLLSDPQACGKSGHEALPQGPLLLVESTSITRPRLLRSLALEGFAVTVVKAPAAREAACNGTFAHVRFHDGNTLDPIRNTRGRQSKLRIVVIADHDSFATVIMARRARADDYLSIPICERDTIDAPLGCGRPLPPISETSLGVERVCWEHIQRIPTPCGHQVSDAARCLRIHRRTLQRLLSKRAPYPRGSLKP
jgi:two-component system, response regulator RegA